MNRLERLALEYLKGYGDALDEFNWSVSNEDNPDEPTACAYYSNVLLEEIESYEDTLGSIALRLRKY